MINEYGMEIPLYRLAGSDSDYGELDMIDIKEETIIKITETFINNKIVLNKMQVGPNGELSRLYIENGEIKEKELEFVTYLKVNIKQIYDNNGTLLIDWYYRLYEFNDGNYGIDLVINSSKMYICQGKSGLNKFFEDKFELI